MAKDKGAASVIYGGDDKLPLGTTIFLGLQYIEAGSFTIQAAGKNAARGLMICCSALRKWELDETVRSRGSGPTLRPSRF
jgi:hypothetical protein